MSNLIQPSLLRYFRAPLTQFQRYRGKINIQRPRAPHYERARVLAVTQPNYPEPIKNQQCFQPKAKKDEANPYNEIIAREVHNWLQHSRMVGVFHMNCMNADELFRIRVLLHKHNMHLKSYGVKILQLALEDTRFEAMLPLFVANCHCLVFSSEVQVAHLLRITRRLPQMLLLGGIVDDTLLSRNELMNYAQLRGLPEVQAELVQTLNAAAGNMVQHLQTHQNNFVNVLDVYAKGVDGVVTKKAKAEEGGAAAPETTTMTKTAGTGENEEKKV